MKSKSAIRILAVLSSLLLIHTNNAESQEKVRYDQKPVSPFKELRAQAKRDTSRRQGLFNAAMARVKQQQARGFDQQRLDKQVTVLKKVSEQRTMAKELHEILHKVKREQADRKAPNLREPERLKLLGKPTRFLKAPASQPQRRTSSLGKAASVLVTNALVNGKARDSISVGDTFNLTFSFAPGGLSAIMNIYLDINNDGLVGSDDYLLGRGLLLDNDDHDENSATGEYKVTFRGGEDILTSFAATLILEVDDHQSLSAVYLTVRQKPTSSIVLGSVLPPIPYVACVSDEVIVFSDSAGIFSFFVDPQTQQTAIRPVDVTGRSNGYIPPSTQLVTTTSDTTIVRFVYTEATSFIEGYVKDLEGRAVENALVEADYSFYVCARTDATGYYRLGVTPNSWYIYVSTPWTSDYMRNLFSSSIVPVPPNATVQRDLLLAQCNNTLSGSITFDGGAVSGVTVYAYLDSLVNSAHSSSDGTYTIPVYDPPAGSNGYTIECFVGSGYFVENSIRTNVQPGTGSVNFVIRKVAGGLQGRITDINTGDPIPGAYVDLSGSSYKYTRANDSGYYRTSLADGTYSLQVNAPLYFGYTEYGILISGAMATRNVALQRSGSFSGKVENEEGAPIDRAFVVAFDSSGMSYQTYALTDRQGRYLNAPLPTGAYKAAVFRDGYVQQWYNMAETAQQGSLIQVVQGFDTPDINFVLSKGGIISGTVVDKNGNPVPDVEIVVFDSLLSWQSYATTNDTGFYAASGLTTGMYFVAAFSEEYFEQWYDGAATPADARPVSVTMDAETPDINFVLAKGGSIAGTVKSKNGSMITDFLVTVVDSVFQPISISYVYHDSDYRMTKLPTGRRLYVLVSASGYAKRWYDNVSTPDSATAITLTGEEERNEVNFILPLGGSIAGGIHNADGYPLPYATVFAFDSAMIYYGYSDEKGKYSITGMSNGIYFVCASSYGYIDQWFDHKATIEEATQVGVKEETVTSNINFTLQRMNGISGTVVDDSSGEGLSSMYVEIFGTGQWTTFTTDDGTYFVPLPPGEYVVRASDYQWLSPYLPEYYTSSGGTPLRREAQRLIVETGHAPIVANFRLQRRKNFYAFDEEKLGMTITNFGQLGYPQDQTQPSGRWPISSGRNHLYEGDFWLGGEVYGYTVVAGGAYQGVYGPWTPLENYREEGGADSKRVVTSFADVGMFGGIVVTQTAHSFKSTDFAVYEYTIVNSSPHGYELSPIQNAHIGFFMDFDVSVRGQKDMVGIDENTNLAYVYDSMSPDSTVLGVCLIKGSGVRLTWWKAGHDPLSDSARHSRLVSPTSTGLPDSAADYRVFLSCGPYSLDPGDSVTVMVAVVAGYGTAGVIQAAVAAQSVTSVSASTAALIPTEYSLLQNYPNPFNPTTMIRFDMPERGAVKLEVYDMLGRRVATLVDGVVEAGRRMVEFDAHALASGVYVYRIEANGFVQAKRMVLVR